MDATSPSFRQIFKMCMQRFCFSMLVFCPKSNENQRTTTNGHHIQILLIEIYRFTNFQPKRMQPAHIFNNFSIFWCATCLFLGVFLVFSLSQIKYSTTKWFPTLKGFGCTKNHVKRMDFRYFCIQKTMQNVTVKLSRLLGTTVQN